MSEIPNELKAIKNEIANLHQLVENKNKEILTSISGQQKISVEIPSTRIIIGIIFSLIGLSIFAYSVYSLVHHHKNISFGEINKETEAKVIKAQITEAELKNSAFNNAMIVSVIGGILMEIIALINFYSYNKSFEINQKFKLAKEICNKLSGTTQQKAYNKIIGFLIKR